MLFIRKSLISDSYKLVFGFAVFAAVALLSDPAFAAACKTKGTLGGLICNTVNNFDDFPGIFTATSYLFGLVLGFMGIMKLKEHVESPNQVDIWDPMKRFIAGGAFFTLPFIANVVWYTIAADDGTYTANDYNTGGVSGDGLDAMLVRLMSDIWEPMQFIMLGFCYLAGIILIMIGISRLLKTEREGARGPMGFGTIMTFIVAGVLLSLNTSLGAAVTTIFDGNGKNAAFLTYAIDGDAKKHAEAVIGAIMAFVAVLGWISFIRGFFIMRGVAEGNQQASAMAGVTHILGGAVAVNLGAFIEAVQKTLQIDKYGLEIKGAFLDPQYIEPYLTAVTSFA